MRVGRKYLNLAACDLRTWSHAPMQGHAACHKTCATSCLQVARLLGAAASCANAVNPIPPIVISRLQVACLQAAPHLSELLLGVRGLELVKSGVQEGLGQRHQNHIHALTGQLLGDGLADA